MSQLASLRRRISTLHRWRALMRGVAAWSAVLIAMFWILAVIFGLDLIFEMNVIERLLVMAIGVAIWIWSMRRYALPHLEQSESFLQVALLVEAKHRIPSDLVAALQFETPDAADWGSAQLEEAVIQQTGQKSRGLHVFAGFSNPAARRRAGILLITVVVFAVTAFFFPKHALTFVRRLAMSGEHYPSATRIELVAVNQRVVIENEDQTAPASVVVAEGRPIVVRVRVAGRLPETGTVRLRSETGRKRTLVLEPLDLQQRRQILQDANEKIRTAIDQSSPVLELWLEEIVTALQFDVPEATEQLQKTPVDQDDLQTVAKSVDGVLSQWVQEAGRNAVFECRLERLVEPVSYQLYLGDAWTDAATIRMIPLPAVELEMVARSPAYASGSQDETAITSNRQLSVLEGSEVTVAIASTNGKQIESAWLTITNGESPQRYELQPEEDTGLNWTLPPENTPLAQVTNETRFEVQVTDEDGLHLETPLRGYVRIKIDRPPTCSADIVHRVVLPTATPTIEYRVNDDYGIADLSLEVRVERVLPDDVAVDPEETDQRITLPLLQLASPLTTESLPLNDRYTLNLGQLAAAANGGSTVELVKGDRLKLTLQATDYRGDLPGETCQSEPLVLEISDESGVLSAISEADERSEERLTEIIKQQLGIGDGP